MTEYFTLRKRKIEDVRGLNVLIMSIDISSAFSHGILLSKPLLSHHASHEMNLFSINLFRVKEFVFW